jgi:rhodanese-related sulfurtransferase
MKRLTKLLLPLFLLFPLNSIAVEKEKSPKSIPGTTLVNVQEAKALFDKGTLFIDARSDKDWDAGRIPDAVHLDVKNNFTEAALLEEITKTDPVVMYCNGESCLRSTEASQLAVSWGFKKVHYFRTGFPSWKVAGYAVE